MSAVGVTPFDTGAFNANLAKLKQAAMENGGGHSVQRAANPGGVDVGAINSTQQKLTQGVQAFVQAMKSMEVSNPTGQYDQMVATAQRVISEFNNRPSVARLTQSNLLSRGGATRALG